MKKHLFTFILFAGIALNANAQQLCGHNSSTWANEMSQYPTQTQFIAKAGTIAYIPLKIHYIRHTDGSFSNNTDPNKMIESILQLNRMWDPIGVQFYLAGGINYIDNDAYLNVERTQPIPYFANKEPGVANVFIVDGWLQNGQQDWAAGWGSPGQVELNSTILSLVSHEFGHFMTLAHTFDTGNGVENVDRTGPNSNCAIAGDGICDTDADPYGLQAGQYLGATHKDTLCHIQSNTTDLHGVLYQPPYDNIMSYHTGDCGRIFTAGQFTKMLAGFQANHAAYPDYVGVGMVNSGPNNVSTTMLHGIPYLTWTNQNGALGTSIEYSTDSGTTWEIAGGVLAGVSEFPLYQTKPGLDYQIRLKHINNKNDYSTPISYSSVYALPDIPFFNRQNLTDLQSIGGVKITNTLVDNSTNDNQSYSLNYYTPTPELQVGVDYPMELKIGTNQGGSGGFSYFAVYLDENNDGDFDDAGETKYLKANGGLEWTVNFNLNVGINAIGGPRILRVRSFFQAGIQDPNKFSIFSETEDYIVYLKTSGITAGVDPLNQNSNTVLFPNPNQGEFTLMVDNLTEKISLTALDGKVVFEDQTIEKGQIKLNVYQNPGMYYLKIIFQDGSIEHIPLIIR